MYKTILSLSLLVILNLVLPTAIAAEPRLRLIDRVKPGTDFYRFRERLRLAIKRRDAKFIESISDPDIKLSFGSPMKLSSLNLNNPQAKIWLELDKLFAVGCENGGNRKATTWICPHVFQAWGQVKLDPFEYGIVVGKNVNIHSQPNINSSIITTVTDQLVKLKSNDINRNWDSIELLDGISGYVSSRFFYSPVGYRAFFEKAKGKWKMTVLIAGD